MSLISRRSVINKAHRINGKCQGFAGTQCEEFHTHIGLPVQNAGNYLEINANNVYHISSNRYYGYLPIMPEVENNYAMDIDDTSTENSMSRVTDPKNECCGNISTSTIVQSVNGNSLSIDVNLGRRKRGSEEAFIETPKKQRKEEQESVNEKNSKSSLQFIVDGYDLDFENLLKQTHGCDLYHYYSCDL